MISKISSKSLLEKYCFVFKIKSNIFFHFLTNILTKENLVFKIQNKTKNKSFHFCETKIKQNKLLYFLDSKANQIRFGLVLSKKKKEH